MMYSFSGLSGKSIKIRIETILNRRHRHPIQSLSGKSIKIRIVTLNKKKLPPARGWCHRQRKYI